MGTSHGCIHLQGERPFFVQKAVLLIKEIAPIFKGSLDEKLPIYEQDPKSKRLDSFEKRFVRD